MLPAAVRVCACTPARAAKDSVAECIHIVLTSALRKFQRRWAPYHILALDRETFAPDQYINEAIEALETNEIRSLDFIFRIDGDEIVQSYLSSGQGSSPI